MTDTIKQIEEALITIEIESLGGTGIKCCENHTLISSKDIQTIKAALSVLQKIASGDDWFPIEDAPRDGSIFLLGYRLETECPQLYSAWYTPAESSFNGEVTEWDGHQWVLNDDEKQLIVDDEDFNCKWKHLDQAKHVQMLMEREMNDAK